MGSIEDLYRKFQQFKNVSTDSRKIEKGSIFFALKGENFNGNKYAGSAIEKGASFAVIDEAAYSIPNKTILVDNVLFALQHLASYHRKKMGIPVLSITGTNGKTTTKELVSAVLAEKFKVTFTQGNLNNHIGVPLTLLSINEGTEFAVVEMGANHPGEIAELCDIASPDYGLITNVGKAHLEGFGSFEGVIKTKTELYRHLNKNKGTVFFNASNPILNEHAKLVGNRISYGAKDADFTGELLNTPPFVHLRAKFPKGWLYLNTNLIGNYNYENVLAAACIGNYFNVDPLKIQVALKNYQPKNNRSQLIKKEGRTIIMDAYNANPTSMEASVTSFLANNASNNFLILGDMLELGEYSDNEHRSVLERLRSTEATNVYLVGTCFSKHQRSFNFRFYNNADELCLFLKDNPIKNGNILIKGSRGIQLEKVLEYI